MGIVKRSEKKSFYGVPGSSDQVTFHLMQKFTEISTSKNPVEYSRQYVHENFEQSDVIGYAPSISVAFDEHTGNAVHEDIINMFDKELTGDGTVREIVIVDLTHPITDSGASYYKARKRSFAVIPNSEGGDLDRYGYSADLKAKGEVIEGKATTTDGWETCTFTVTE